MKRKHKRPLTLLEIMIVIFLIGLIGSAIGYNMKGSLDKGRAFKTEQAILRIQDALEIAIAEDPTFDVTKPDLVSNVLEKSGLFKDPDNALKDAWGKNITVSLDEGNIEISSEGLEIYKNKNVSKSKSKLKNETASEATN